MTRFSPSNANGSRRLLAAGLWLALVLAPAPAWGQSDVFSDAMAADVDPVVQEAMAFARDGRPFEALAMLESYLGILPSAEDAAHFHALLAHTQISLETDQLKGIEASLRWLADFSLEHGEVGDYRSKVAHLYAVWFLASGAEESAARMLDSAAWAALAEGRPTVGLDYLLALGEVYRAGRQEDRLRQTWFRIDTLLHEQGSRVESGAAVEARLYRSEASSELARLQGAGLPAETVFLPGRVDLQPAIAAAAVGETESARTRATLTNTSTLPISGTVSIETEKGYSVEWNTTGRIHRLNLVPSWWSQGGIAEQRPMTLPPGSEVRLYVVCPPAKSGMAEATLHWKPEKGTGTSGAHASAVHRFIFAPDRRPAAMVHASDSRWNPAYSVPIYTEIIHRAPAPATHDFKAICDQGACRVEYFDESTGELIAIDAQGDGDFTGDGDVLAQDANRDRFPDLTLSPRNHVGSLELLVFPDPGINGTVEVALSFHTRDPSLAWKTFDENVSRMRVRSSGSRW